MKLVEYIEKARTTALYPDLGSNIYYPTLGLAGECAEVFDKVYFDAQGDEIEKELGDVMWYVANVATELNIVDALESTAPSFIGSELEVCTFMVISCGRICECVKKTMRDTTDGVMPEAKLETVKFELNQIIKYVGIIAEMYDSSIVDVCQTNIKKLFSRKERGVLTGDGDNR
jgi:NTP pyrophosphatase (non-canonical NTP hydrolase)